VGDCLDLGTEISKSYEHSELFAYTELKNFYQLSKLVHGSSLASEQTFRVHTGAPRRTGNQTCMGQPTTGLTAGQILWNFIQFGSHASRTPCAAMNFGLGHGPRHPVPNVKCLTHWGQISLGGAKKAEFSKFFVLNAKFLEVSRQNLLVAELLNWYFGSRVTTHAQLNEIVQ
jgi:hypothetical protein